MGDVLRHAYKGWHACQCCVDHFRRGVGAGGRAGEVFRCCIRRMEQRGRRQSGCRDERLVVRVHCADDCTAWLASATFGSTEFWRVLTIYKRYPKQPSALSLLPCLHLCTRCWWPSSAVVPSQRRICCVLSMRKCPSSTKYALIGSKTHRVGTGYAMPTLGLRPIQHADHYRVAEC